MDEKIATRQDTDAIVDSKPPIVAGDGIPALCVPGPNITDRAHLRFGSGLISTGFPERR